MIKLPEEFLETMKEMLGDEYQAFLDSYEEPRKYGLRVNTLKISPEEFQKLAPFHLEPIPWTDNGFYYLEQDQASRHAFYYAGLYYLQEPSAMTPALRPGGAPGRADSGTCAPRRVEKLRSLEQGFREKACWRQTTSALPGQRPC